VTAASWDLQPAAARRLQEELREKVIVAGGPAPEAVRLAAGLDVSFDKEKGVLHAAVVVLELPKFNVVETGTAVLPATFPYVPGLLSFRESPVLVQALEKIQTEPDLLVFDGQGIAHPRGLGIASHLGVLFDRPSIGIAKSLLVGDYESPPPVRGGYSTLFYRGEPVGTVVRTRTGVKPVFVSPGHLVGIAEATRLALALSQKFRIPEPTRAAHNLCTALRRGEGMVP
jgi:deoxyribonuclease V